MLACLDGAEKVVGRDDEALVLDCSENALTEALSSSESAVSETFHNSNILNFSAVEDVTAIVQSYASSRCFQVYVNTNLWKKWQ